MCFPFRQSLCLPAHAGSTPCLPMHGRPKKIRSKKKPKKNPKTIQFSDKIDKNILGPNFSTQSLPSLNFFQIERIRQLACLPSFCEPVLLFILNFQVVTTTITLVVVATNRFDKVLFIYSEISIRNKQGCVDGTFQHVKIVASSSRVAALEAFSIHTFSNSTVVKFWI